MFNSPIIQSQFGQHFIIITLRHSNQLPGLSAETFSSTSASRQFITQLNPPLGYWQQIAQQLHTFPYTAWQKQNPWSDIESYIAQAIAQGVLKVFKTASLKELVISTSSRSIKTGSGKRYQIRPASSAFLTPLSAQQKIQDVKAAESFITELALDEETISALHASTKSDNASASTEIKQQQIVEAIVNGELVVDLEPEPTKPLSEGEFIEEVVQAAQPEPAPAANPEPTTQSSDQSGQEASAAVLEKAAEDGTPFCEECENAA